MLPFHLSQDEPGDHPSNVMLYIRFTLSLETSRISCTSVARNQPRDRAVLVESVRPNFFRKDFGQARRDDIKGKHIQSDAEPDLAS